MANFFDQFDAPSSPRALPPVGALPGTLHLNAAAGDAPRPFAPGEFLENPDGSWSNEITTTQTAPQLNGGRPSVIPTLWIIGGKPVRVSEDQAVDLAAKSGLAFPSFDTPGAAEAFANQREANWQNVDPHNMSGVKPLYTSAATPATPAAATPAAQPNFFDQFDAPVATPAAKPNTLVDTVASLASGVPRGIAETIMLPVTAERALHSGADWLYTHGENLARSAFGLPAITDAERQQRAAAAPDPDPIGSALYTGQDAVRRGMNDVLYQPRTTPGHFAETVGEFIAPGGLPSKAARIAPTAARKAAEYAADLTRGALVPGVTSEALGEATADTPYEAPARVAGALLGNAATGVAKMTSAPEIVLRRTLGDPNAIDWEKAVGLQNNSTGVKLTGPEAIAQAQGGASALPNLQRVVEGSVQGRAATAPFFAARPGQVDAAVNNVLDRIAPQSAVPSTIGPRVATAAESAIAASPEGRALTDAIMGAGPRTTALQAGETIQPELRRTFDRREGMRNALADADYAAARTAEPSVPVSDLQPETTVTRPAFTRIAPATAEGADEGAAATRMVPENVPAEEQTPALTSRTGGEVVQVDARPVVQFIDNLIPNARAGTQDALRTVRGMLFDQGGVDTGVNGLDAARGQIGDMITQATQTGQRQTADLLGQVQRHLDEALSSVPEYARARQTFRAASVPLEPFESPGMAKVVSRDAFNRQFTTPPENVPSALAAPSEARNFNQVASPDARTAMENHVATQILDQATDAAGNVSGERLATVLRANQDLLSQFPTVADRLNAVLNASNGMAAARTGPLGRIAEAGDTAAAGNAVLPQNPMVGSHGETADAVRRLAAQDPQATSELVRQILGDRYAKAATETQEGSREFSGTKFHKAIAGNEQRQATLDAALGALPNGAPQGLSELLDVLQATGRRKAIGSATEFNRALNADLGTSSPLAYLRDVAATLGTNFLTKSGDALQRLHYRRNLGALADLFTDPQSVERIREAAARGAPSVLPEVAGRTAAQTLPIMAGSTGR